MIVHSLDIQRQRKDKDVTSRSLTSWETHMKPRIVFMGTPDIACAMLKQLLEDGYEVVGVVSQPDKKAGRKQELKMSEVKQMALAHRLPIFQPFRIKENYETILRWQPDLIVTCAYGQFIPSHILDFPRYGSINVHASLLPKYRGGAPIHWAIINGETKTGMSIMRMVSKMDAGAVMAQSEVSIGEDDTMGDVYEKLKVCGAKLLHESIPRLLSGDACFTEQDETKASFAYNIAKEEERIDIHTELSSIYNHIRGLIPQPCAYALIHGKKLKFHKARKMECDHDKQNGELCGMLSGGYAFAFKGGYLIADELQLEGKSSVDAKAFANGQGKNWLGQCLE